MIKYILGFVIAVAVILVGITIGANNDQLITFNYVIAQSELRLSTLVAILFGFGLNRRVKRQSQQITELTSPKAE